MAAKQRKRIAHNFQDLTGQRFQRLVVIGRGTDSSTGQTRWNCVCDCGSERLVLGGKLKSGHTGSCGCLRDDINSRVHRTHGLSKMPEYKIWKGIIKRCENPNSARYADYGGRGITIFPEWRNDFPAFLAYVGPRPSPQHSIDRYPNQNGNYEPDNVRWATQTEQTRNFRSNRLLTLNGITDSLAEWSERTGINYGTLKDRIKCGWSHERALTTPTLKTWSRHFQRQAADESTGP